MHQLLFLQILATLGWEVRVLKEHNVQPDTVWQLLTIQCADGLSLWSLSEEIKRLDMVTAYINNDWNKEQWNKIWIVDQENICGKAVLDMYTAQLV